MCGIVGYISTSEHIHEKAKRHFMRYALALDTLRGDDSTGIMTVRNKFTVDTLKTLLPGDTFVQTKEYHQKMKIGWASVGHNRAATKGSVTLENAHPFTFGPVTLVHNGTLFKAGADLDTYDKSLAVDSMQIANALSQSATDKVPEVLKEIDGSFALVWFDKRDESVNMARNTDRPLHFGFNANRNIMWFMSDGHHLHSINKSLKGDTSAASVIYQLDKHKWLKWKKGDLVPEVTNFDPFVRPVVVATTRPTPTAGGHSTTGTTTTTPTNRWKKAMQSGAQQRNSGFVANHEELKTPINGKDRKVPLPHINSLISEYELGPRQLLKFEPEDLFDLGNHKMMVTGTISHPGWGDTPWDAVIYNAKEVQAKAYREENWLVRPIGVGLPVSADRNNASIICHLIHCSWKDYEANCKEEDDKVQKAERDAQARRKRELEANKGAADMGKAVVPFTGASPNEIEIKGPDGKYVAVSILRSMCESGCIQCGSVLTLGDVEECIYVNEGRDLLCEPCHIELQQNICIAANDKSWMN